MVKGNDRVIAVINNKGGVGKTTTVANIGGQLAGTYRVLLVDLDPQGHLGIPLGYYRDADAGDDLGMRIVEALQEDEPLPDPIIDVRPGLDVYPGGSRLTRIAGLEMSGEIQIGAAAAFAEKLAEVAVDYDFVFIDCPPGERLLQQMALAAARYVLTPVDTGRGSTESLRDNLAPLVTRARKDNPELTYLGAIVTKQPASATRVLKNTRLRLDEFSEHVPILESYVRNAVKPAQDSEQRGQLLHELAGELETNKAEYFKALREQDHAKLESLASSRISSTAADLARDYRDLAGDIVQRVASHEATTPIRKSR